VKRIKRISAKAWVSNWKKLGPELELIQIEEHKRSKLADTLLSLSDINEASLLTFPPTADSGMIEMQRLFSKLHK
jgi:hypothetical protein